MEAIKVTEEGNQAAQALMGQQIDLEQQMVNRLDLLIKATGGILQGDDLISALKMQAAGETLGAGGIRDVTEQSLGLKKLDDQNRYAVADAAPRFFDSMSEDQQKHFEALRRDYIGVLNAGLDMSTQSTHVGKYRTGPSAMARQETGPTRRFTSQGQVESAQEELRNELLKIAEVAEEFSTNIDRAVAKPKADPKAATGEDFDKEQAELKAKAQRIQVEAYRKFESAQMKVIAGINQSTAELMAKEPTRLAIAARDFGTSLDDMIEGFKKAEALAFTDAQMKEKWKSDLEGPFARVGQPGFKTSFEQRREELEAGGGRPMSMQAMRDRTAERKKIDFDEDEAKIKQKQDFETKKLRDQQGQAEQFRSLLADTLFSGQLDDTGLSGDAKRVMDQLTQEMAESEQAYMKGGELFFKGIPSLEEATRLAAKAKEVAKEKAMDALGAKDKKFITDPIVTELRKITSGVNNLSAGGVAGVAALPPGAVKGIPAISTGAAGPMTDAQAYSALGMPDQRTGAAAPGGKTRMTDAAAYAALGMPDQRTGAPAPGGTVGPDAAAAYAAGSKAGGPTGLAPVEPTVISQAMIDSMAQIKKLGLSTSQSGMLSEVSPAIEVGTGPKLSREDKIKKRQAEFEAQMASANKTDGSTFVKEQIIGPSKESLEEKENFRKRMAANAMMRGATSYAPGGSGETSFNKDNLSRILGGQEVTKMPQVGRSNNILQRDINVNKLGDADAQDGGAPRNPDRPTAQEDIENRDRETGPTLTEGGGAGSEEVKSAIETLCGKVEKIIEAIGGIGDLGTKIDAATTAVEAVPEQISLDGATVEVSNASEIGAATGDAVNSNLTDLGSAVTEGVTKIAALETLVGGEDVETRVAAAIEAQNTATTAQIAAAEAAAITAAQEAAATEAAETVTNINTSITELQAVRDTLESQANQQTGLIEQIENSIEVAQGDLAEAVTKAEDAATKAETAQENLDDVKAESTAAMVAAEEAKALAEAAQTTAEGAEDTANAASTKTDQTKVELDQECVARQNSERDIEAEALRAKAADQVQDTKIQKLQKDSAIALQNAKLALNKAVKP